MSGLWKLYDSRTARLPRLSVCGTREPERATRLGGHNLGHGRREGAISHRWSIIESGSMRMMQCKGCKGCKMTDGTLSPISGRTVKIVDSIDCGTAVAMTAALMQRSVRNVDGAWRHD